MRKPIRVLFLIGDLNPGGSESHVARLIINLDRTRVRPELMLMRAEGPFLEEVRGSGAPVHDLKSGAGMRGIFERVLRIRSTIARLRPDVVHAYGFPFDIYTALLSLPRRGKKIVTSRRGNQDLPRVRWLYRMTNPLVDCVLCVSRATEQFAAATEGLSKVRSKVIPNGIDIDSFETAGTPARPIRTLGTLGRLRVVKGQDLLLEAFSRLGRPDLLLKVGGPADTPWGVAFQKKFEGSPGVSFPGSIHDVPAFLRSLDLFVLPSRSEGMSNALLEAMSMGLPIVATDVGSNAEVLDGGNAGMIVEPDAASIADGIARMIDDPARAADLGRRARKRVEEEYSLHTMVRRYEAFYEELAGARAS